MTRPLVVLTVGTDTHPFDRLVAWMGRWAAAHPDVEVVGQVGTSTHDPAPMAAEPLLPFPDLVDLVGRAAAVVCHGGPATVADVRATGRTPLVVPRRADLGEHVDDHQVRFSRHLEAVGDAVVIHHLDDLEHHLTRAVAEPSRYRVEPDRLELDAAIRRFADLVDALEPRRRPLWRRWRGRGPVGARA